MATSIKCLNRCLNIFHKSKGYQYVMTPCHMRRTNSGSYSTSVVSINSYNEKDPAPLFFNKKIQDLLTDLTGLDLKKVFFKRYLEHDRDTSEFKFFTEDDLKKIMDESIVEAKKLLQMPPVLKKRKDITEVISRDPELQGEETQKLIFTDITFGMSDRKRRIVVRDPDGTLRAATWEERHRMNEIYNPKPARYLAEPEAFEEEHFKPLLLREEYIFILNLACAHYEPDDPKYQDIVAQTYEHINKRSNQEILYSTRHFGPYCFYLAWNKKIDNLLVQYVNAENLRDAAKLIQVHYIINDDDASAEIAFPEEGDEMTFIKKYAESGSSQRPQLTLAIQSYDDLQAEKLKQLDMIKESQGLQ